MLMRRKVSLTELVDKYKTELENKYSVECQVQIIPTHYAIITCQVTPGYDERELEFKEEFEYD